MYIHVSILCSLVQLVGKVQGNLYMVYVVRNSTPSNSHQSEDFEDYQLFTNPP